MIDYIKAYFPDKNEILSSMQKNYNLEKLTYSRFDKEKNENVLYETYKKTFDNMELKITNQEAYIHNSLHHFYNSFVHGIEGNYNDFSHSCLINSIDILEEQLKYSASKLELSQGLEFGLNIIPPFDVDEFVLQECVLFDFREPSVFPEAHSERVYKEFQRSNYRLKIYHKGRHQGIDENLLRIEIKFMDKRVFNKLGIFALTDLEDRDNLISLYDKLYNHVKFKLMCVDNIENMQFTEYKKNKLYKYCSFKYWSELSKEQFKIESKKVYPYFEKNKLLENKNTLLTLMDNKFKELLNK